MSLFHVQREALTVDFKKFGAAQCHLIVDQTTHPIVEKLFKDDILNYVYTFKMIDLDRSKNRDSAIYLLDPTRKYSLDCLMADFQNGQRYKDVVVFFMPGNWEPFWKAITQNKYFTNALIKQQHPLITYYLSIFPLEDRLYVTGNYHSIPAYYNSEVHGSNIRRYQMDMAINSMVGICILTNEYPTIRYYNSPTSKELAHRLKQKLDDYYRNNDIELPKNRPTFLITDRTMDMFGPLCHYQYYSSQIFDLLDEVEIVRGIDVVAKYSYNVQTGEGTTKKTLKFDSDDHVYMQLKDLKIEAARQRLIDLYSELKKEDEKFSGKNLEYSSGLRHALVNKDSHATNKALITGHNILCKNMWGSLKNEHVADIITFENYCAAGMGPYEDLKVPVTDGLLQLLKNPEINLYNKIRLLVVYAIYRQGIIKADLTKLLQFSMPDKTDNVVKLFENLQTIGVCVLKNDLIHTSKKKCTYFGLNQTENQMEMYVPSYTNIVSRMVYNKLPEHYNTLTLDRAGYLDDDDDSTKSFPFLTGALPDMDDEPMVRAQPKWENNKNSVSRQKLYIFCAGGLTPSEISSISSLEDELNRNIVVGTDEVYTVWDMLGDINLINDNSFDFPLKEKLKQKPIPDFLLQDSFNPVAIAQKQQQQQQNASVNNGSQHHQHRHHLSLKSHHNDPVAVSVDSEPDAANDKPKKKHMKGMIKKIKKISI